MDKIILVPGKFILVIAEGLVQVPPLLHYSRRRPFGVENVDNDYLVGGQSRLEARYASGTTKAYLACKVVILRAGRPWSQLRFLHHFLSPFGTTTTSTIQYELWSQVCWQEEASFKQPRDNVVEVSLAVEFFLFELSASKHL
jgi:hypothetical protein